MYILIILLVVGITTMIMGVHFKRESLVRWSSKLENKRNACVVVSSLSLFCAIWWAVMSISYPSSVVRVENLEKNLNLMEYYVTTNDSITVDEYAYYSDVMEDYNEEVEIVRVMRDNRWIGGLRTYKKYDKFVKHEKINFNVSVKKSNECKQ